MAQLLDLTGGADGTLRALQVVEHTSVLVAIGVAYPRGYPRSDRL